MNDVMQSTDEDVPEVLIAISVVAGRLEKTIKDKKELYPDRLFLSAK